MGPSDVSSRLFKIASAIESSTRPNRKSVAREVKKILSSLEFHADLIMDGVFPILRGDDPYTNGTPFKVKNTSTDSINGNFSDGGTWFFKLEPEPDDGYGLYGEVNGEKYGGSYFPSEGESPQDFGARMIRDIIEVNDDLSLLFSS